MEDFSFRPSYDSDKPNNSFFSSVTPFFDHLDAPKAPFKFENLSPFQGAQDFRKARLNSFDYMPFFALNKEEDHYPSMQDHAKAENMTHNYPQLGGQQSHLDVGFDNPFSGKMHDYSDNYRLGRSRGPSFNIGSGRKPSEDFFANGLDLFNFMKNQEQRERTFSFEGMDPRMHHGFGDEYKAAPLVPNGFMNQGYVNMQDNNYAYGMQGSLDASKDSAMNPQAYNFQNTQNNQYMQSIPEQPVQETSGSHENANKTSDLEPSTKKKRKLNNAKEAPAEESELPANTQLKKSKSENKKGSKTKEPQPPQLKSSKSTVTNPKNNTKSKKTSGKGPEEQEKSTVASSVNVSPVAKKEDLPGVLNSNSTIVEAFGNFKKPETAQELLGGISLPAEVEEYINNSKIFNQIKAPVPVKIGTLTIEERRAKIEKYLEKRKRRTWNKKVNYDCRKKVADNRLRIKGRFVTKDQAFSMMEALGIFPDPETITNAEIKEILTKNFGGITRRKGRSGEGENQVKFEGGNGSEEQESSGYESGNENYLKD